MLLKKCSYLQLCFFRKGNCLFIFSCFILNPVVCLFALACLKVKGHLRKRQPDHLSLNRGLKVEIYAKLFRFENAATTLLQN